jgi:5,10-methylenetetrahydromethanopterin reductase
MRIRFGLRIPPCADLREVTATVRAAETAGFDVAWLPDSQFLWRDVWAAMALAATATQRIALGTCVTQFETRHATVTAAAAATIDELAPGRAILGVGTGDSAIKTLGLAPTRLSAMRAHIESCRALWTGRSVEFGGRVMTLRATPPSGRLPIYMAATGPKALALAGEIADGVIILAGVAPELIERSLRHIRDGAARAGRDLAELDICLGTFCHVSADEREAARVVKPYACTLAQIGGTDALELAGIDVAVPAVIPEVYPDMGHAENWDQACEVAGRWITDDMALRYAEKFCFVGDAPNIKRKIDAALDCGITSFYLRSSSSYALPMDVLTTFGSQVIPHFR